MNTRWRFAGAAGSALALVALAATEPAVAVADVVARTSGAHGGWWTAKRIARARPLSVTREGAETSLKQAPLPPPFESFEVPDPSVPPLPAHGKVFGVLPGFGKFECSATVISTPGRNVVMTAGHCVYEPHSRVAARRLTFIPAYTDGARPFGRWSAAEARSTRDWIRRENFDYDYATLTMRPLGGRRIEEVVGGRARAGETPRAQTNSANGYPVNFADASRLWTCHGGYAGDDPRPIPDGPAPVGMGCNMKAGASGGGWVNDLGQLVSVTSFGYRKRKGFLYGPYLTSRTARLVARSD